MLEDLHIRHYSPTTIRTYLHGIAKFARHFGKPPDQLDAEHIRCFEGHSSVRVNADVYSHAISRSATIRRRGGGKNFSSEFVRKADRG
ncbi:MAG TPA: phage integrase N-terminal SAM-like domain-containing protein [Bryobacteraceae bacterium]|nr:phage integrase N-terminal SAM-like domain-containing protein [Bryobacteraceae bacterium]